MSTNHWTSVFSRANFMWCSSSPLPECFCSLFSLLSKVIWSFYCSGKLPPDLCLMADLRFSWQWLWILPFAGMWCHVGSYEYFPTFSSIHFQGRRVLNVWKKWYGCKEGRY
jgi:hypothetical protein